MIRRSLLRLSAALAAAVFGLVQPADAVIELPGPGAVTFVWAPASGPVAGYFVYVSNDGAPEYRYSTVSGGTSETILGNPGDAIVVSVTAFDAQGNEGPVSPPSELVRFVEAPAPEPPEDPPPGDDLPQKATLLDFDGDGLSDLLLRNRDTGEIQIWTLGQSGVLDEIALPDLPAGWWIAGNGDYDGDGFADILLREESTGRLHLWLIRDGAVAAEGGMAESPAIDWEVAGSSDYDGDGRADLLLRNRAVGRLQIWRMDGTEVVGVSELEDPFGEGWEVVATGDYDGDGRADILWQGGAELSFWLLGGSSEALEVGQSLPSANWEVVGTGDYDGDGQSDILERERDTGRLVASLVANAEVIQRVVIGGSQHPRRREVVGGGDFDGDGHSDILVGFPALRGHRILFLSGAQVSRILRLPRLAAGWDFEAVGEEGLAVYR